MKFILTAILFTQVFAAGEKIKTNAVEWHSNIAGTYSGTLFSAGYDIPVETTFYFEDGLLLGEYVMDEDGTMTQGDLSRIEISEDYSLTCTWTDIYGSGPVSFVFTENCTWFAGFWSSSSGSDSYNWWGEKEEREIQQLIRN